MLLGVRACTPAFVHLGFGLNNSFSKFLEIGIMRAGCKFSSMLVDAIFSVSFYKAGD